MYRRANSRAGWGRAVTAPGTRPASSSAPCLRGGVTEAISGATDGAMGGGGNGTGRAGRAGADAPKCRSNGCGDTWPRSLSRVMSCTGVSVAAHSRKKVWPFVFTRTTCPVCASDAADSTVGPASIHTEARAAPPSARASDIPACVPPRRVLPLELCAALTTLEGLPVPTVSAAQPAPPMRWRGRRRCSHCGALRAQLFQSLPIGARPPR